MRADHIELREAAAVTSRYILSRIQFWVLRIYQTKPKGLFTLKDARPALQNFILIIETQRNRVYRNDKNVNGVGEP